MWNRDCQGYALQMRFEETKWNLGGLFSRFPLLLPSIPLPSFLGNPLSTPLFSLHHLPGKEGEGEEEEEEGESGRVGERRRRRERGSEAKEEEEEKDEVEEEEGK